MKENEGQKKNKKRKKKTKQKKTGKDRKKNYIHYFMKRNTCNFL